MKRFLTVIASLLCITSIIVAFLLPKIYFNWKDTKIINQDYNINLINYKLRSDAEDIVQVMDIFTLYNDSTSLVYTSAEALNNNTSIVVIRHEEGSSEMFHQITVYDGLDNKEDNIDQKDTVLQLEEEKLEVITGELRKLADIGLFPQASLDWETEQHLVATMAQGDFFYAKWEENGSYLSLILDCKTGKIIKMTNGLKKQLGKPDKEQLMAYISYLQLDVLDDWKHEGSVADSKKGGIKVVFLEEENLQTLSILPTSIPIINN